MRYYKINITDKNGKTIEDGHGNKFLFDSSKNPAGALHVVFDLPVFSEDVNIGGGSVVIYGLPLSMLNQSVNLWLANITIEAGFMRGLPLATAQPRPGVIIKGQIWSPYGNWEGVNQTLNLVVNPSSSLDENGKEIAINFSGRKGEKLADVLERCLKEAFPQKTIDIDIHQNLVLSEDMPAVPYNKLSNLAQTIRNNTQRMLNKPGYNGVYIVTQNGGIRVFDNDASGTLLELKAQDLIGQPTWTGFNLVSVKTPLRSDIQVGDRIKLPLTITSGPGALLARSSQQSHTAQRSQVNFSGYYQVMSMRHIGEYHTPTGIAWVTTFEVSPINEGA
ncbi:hypothetical protein [Enterobacter ludwigii]|uniref:hypothetical protein n=1 Tax=Enterobacter TaxID=547 RepID=UPI003BEEE92F